MKIATERHWLPAAWFSAGVGCLVFLYRLLAHSGFSNDHFVHLSRAQAFLLGDWPIRDYTEEGIPLTVMLSAGSQWLFGPSPFAELILAATSFAVAAAVTCWLVSELTRSRLLAVFAVALQVAIMPRLYSHPKILVYPVLLLLAYWYLRQPSRGRLVPLAAWTGVAFLLRHDHGVYAGIGAIAAIVVARSLVRPRDVLRQCAEYILMVAVIVAPYLMYVQYQIGIYQYFQIGIAISRTERESAGRWPSFEPVARGPLLTRRPPTPDDLVARASVPGLRERFAEWVAWAGLSRLSPGPPLISLTSTSNQLVFLFYLIWLLPLLVGLIWWSQYDAARLHSSRVVAVAAVVALACAFGFAREATWNRVADMFGTFPILVAWLTAAGFRSSGSFVNRSGAMALACCLVVSTGATAANLGSLQEQIDQTEVAKGPRAAMARLKEVVSETRTWPWQSQWPASDDWQVASYVHDCTRPADRLLVTWNAPEFNYFSRRGFAGGETLLVPVFRAPAGYESTVLKRLQAQSVPIILGEREETDYFRSRYPAIARYMDEAYRRAGDHYFRPGHDILVFVERTLEPVEVDPVFGWPCFARSGATTGP